MSVDVDAAVIAFTALLALVTAVATALVPALRLDPVRLAETVKSGGKGAVGGSRQHRIRSALIVGEVALSIALLVGAGTMLRTFVALMRAEPGFDDRNLLSFQVALPWTYPDAEKIRFQERAIDALRATPGITAAALNANLPLTDVGQPDRGLVLAEGQPEEERLRNPYVNYQRVSDEYFATMRIPLLTGRTFTDRDADSTAPRVAVVSARLARRLWPATEPLGRRLRSGGGLPGDSSWVTVVGVARDVKFDSLASVGGYDVYLSSRQYPTGWTYYVARTRVEPMSLAEQVKRAVWSIDANQAVFDIRPMRARVLDTVWQHRLAAALFGVFAAVALGLAATGIYGVISYLVREQTREIGVRMALGARRSEIVRGVVLRCLRVTVVGTAVGLLVAFFLARGMASLLPSVGVADPLVFVAVTLLVVSVGVVAALVPAARAARVDPMVALRFE
jgi:putative ABC transport system permease protein